MTNSLNQIPTIYLAYASAFVVLRNLISQLVIRQLVINLLIIKTLSMILSFKIDFNESKGFVSCL